MNNIKRIFLVLALLLAPLQNAAAAIALVASLADNSTSGNGFTTVSYNDTGANFIIVQVVTNFATSGTLTDSNSNSWIPLTQFSGAFSDRFAQFYYCISCTVGSGHTFSITGTSTFPSLGVLAFSGVDTSSPFDVQNGSNNGFANTVTTGSITPGVSGELIIAGLQYDDSTTATITGGATTINANPQTGFGWTGQVMAYFVQSVATSVNLTWSWTNNSRNIGIIASFKPGGTPPPPTSIPLRALMGAGQ